MPPPFTQRRLPYNDAREQIGNGCDMLVLRRATTGRPYYHVMPKTLRGRIFTRYNALIRGVFFLFVNGIMIIYF